MKKIILLILAMSTMIFAGNKEIDEINDKLERIGNWENL